MTTLDTCASSVVHWHNLQIIVLNTAEAERRVISENMSTEFVAGQFTFDALVINFNEADYERPMMSEPQPATFYDFCT